MGDGSLGNWDGQEATVRIGHVTMDWFKIGKAVYQGCIIVALLI